MKSIKPLALFITALAATQSSASESVLNQGILLFSQNHIEQATPLFQEARKLKADESVANMYLGRIEMANERFDEAEEYLEQAVEQSSENAEIQFWYGAVNCDQAGRASIFSAPGYAKTCYKAFEKAIALDPSFARAKAGLIQFYAKAPSIVGGDLERATLLAKELVGESPEKGYPLLAQIYFDGDDKQKEAATKLLLESIQKYPQSADLHYEIGMQYQQQKQYAEAFSALEKSQQLAKEKLAKIQSKLEASSQSFEQQVEAHQENNRTQSTLQKATYQIGKTAILSNQNLERGATALEAYLNYELMPGSSSKSWAHYRLGLIYELQDRKEQAQQAFLLAKTNAQDERLLEQLEDKLN